jgi:hypothetical protein
MPSGLILFDALFRTVAEQLHWKKELRDIYSAPVLCPVDGGCQQFLQEFFHSSIQLFILNISWV